MADTFTDALDSMIEESQRTIRRLRSLADVPHIPQPLRISVIEILHAEGLRLEMLRSAYEEIGANGAPECNGAEKRALIDAVIHRIITTN